MKTISADVHIHYETDADGASVNTTADLKMTDAFADKAERDSETLEVVLFSLASICSELGISRDSFLKMCEDSYDVFVSGRDGDTLGGAFFFRPDGWIN